MTIPQSLERRCCTFFWAAVVTRFVACTSSAAEAQKAAASIQDARLLLNSLGASLSGIKPCKGADCVEDPGERSLSTSLLAHLRRQPGDASRHFRRLSASIEEEELGWQDHAEAPPLQQHSEDETMSWPCASAEDGHSPDRSYQPARSALWHTGVWLRKCGVPGIQVTWPQDDGEWSKLSFQMMSGIGALGKARSDNVSLVCPRPKVIQQASAKSIGSAAAVVDEEEVVEGLEDEGENSTAPRPSLRCPRCARVVGADPAAQKDLVDMLRGLTAEATFGDDSEGHSAADYSFAQSDSAKDDECIASERHSERQLTLARDSGVGNALAAGAQLFVCGTCQLDGLARFLRSSFDAPGDTREAVAIGDLIVTKCASQVPDAISADRLLRSLRRLEKALWSGVGFPSFHDLAAQYVLDLRSADRLEGAVLRDLGAPLCKTELRRVTDLPWSHSISGDAPGDSRFLSIWTYEREALHRWAPKVAGDQGDPFQLSVAYFDLSNAVEEPLQVAVSLCNAALWLKEAQHVFEGSDRRPRWALQHIADDPDALLGLNRSLESAIEQVTEAAYEIAVSLGPGQQLIVFRMCSSAGRANLAQPGQALRQSATDLKLLALTRMSPFWSPPFTLVADAMTLGAMAAQLHAAYSLRMQSLDPVSVHEDSTGPAAMELSLYDAALADSRLRDAASQRPAAMGAVLKLAGQGADWQGVQETLRQGLPSSNSRGSHLLEDSHESLESGAMHQDSFGALSGLRVDLDTGSATLLLERPQVSASQSVATSISPATIVAIMQALHQESPAITLDAPTIATSLRRYIGSARHPFQRLRSSTSIGNGIVKRHLTRSTLALQHLASGGMELSLRPPFPVQKCSGANAACSKLPAKLTITTADVNLLQRDSELRVKCGDMAYSVWKSSPGVLDIRFDAPHLDVAISESGTDGPLRRLAAALSEDLNNAANPWAGLASLRPLCTLRAAAVLLAKDPSDLVPAFAGGQRDSIKSSSRAEHRADHGGVVAGLPRVEHRYRSEWLGQLMDAHALMLRSLGLSNLDPGQCFDDTFTFGRCCSVGDYSSSCWQPGFSEERCCLRLSLGDLGTPALEAAARHLAQMTCYPYPTARIQSTIAAWLQQPTGSIATGNTFSGAVADLLEDEARFCGTGQPKIQASALGLEAGPAGKSSAEAGAKMEELIPGLLLGQMPRLGVLLEPTLLPRPGGAMPLAESVQPLRLEELSERVDQSHLHAKYAIIAAACPQLRALRWLNGRLSKLHKRAARSVKVNSMAPEAPTELDVSSEDSGGACCSDSLGWNLLRAEQIADLRVGQLLRIRNGRHAAAQEAQIASVLHVSGRTGSSATLHRVRILKTGSMSYFNFSQPGLLVTYSHGGGGGDCSMSAEQCSKKSSRKSEWPDCVRQGETIRGVENAGVFVNLVGFGISSGCFRDDCTHSDHFDTSSPASCAQTCASIRACQWWSFWVSASGGVCWLRRHDRHRLPMINSVAAAADCVPPAGQALPKVDWHHLSTSADSAGPRNRRRGEPTLFELAQGPWGIGPRHPYHQWDLVQVLEAFGHSTPSQVEAQEASALQQSALRFARRAQRLWLRTV